MVEPSNNIRAGRRASCSIGSIVASMRTRRMPHIDPAYFERLSFSLFTLPDQKRQHVMCVVDNFHSFVAGDHDALYLRLPKKKCEGTTEKAYSMKLGQVKAIYDSLGEEEKREIYIALILHDIGIGIKNGWDHGPNGRQEAVRLVRGANIPVEAEKVGFLVANHGLINTFGVDILPPRLFSFDPAIRKQIFIMDCMDSTAKGKDQHSDLSLQNLEDNFEVFNLTPEYLKEHPGWLLDFRLRHLLSPANFISLNDHELHRLEYEIKKHMTSHQVYLTMKMLESHLANVAFPVFQDLYSSQGRITELVFMLRELACTVAAILPREGETVRFRTEPDILSLEFGGNPRNHAMAHIRKALDPSDFTFDRKREFKITTENGQKTITLGIDTQRRST